MYQGIIIIVWAIDFWTSHEANEVIWFSSSVMPLCYQKKHADLYIRKCPDANMQA